MGWGSQAQRLELSAVQPLGPRQAREPELGLALGRSPAELAARIDAARTSFREEPAASLAVAIEMCECAESDGDATLVARARALEGHIHLHHGDIRRAVARSLEAERLLGGRGDGDCAAAWSELAALQAQVAFFTGAYAQALACAERAVALADATARQDLRLFARRCTSLVLGNVAVSGLGRRLDETLELALALATFMRSSTRSSSHFLLAPRA
jgi:tetratricopeptide (TPR) repeat protein